MSDLTKVRLLSAALLGAATMLTEEMKRNRGDVATRDFLETLNDLEEVVDGPDYEPLFRSDDINDYNPEDMK